MKYLLVFIFYFFLNSCSNNIETTKTGLEGQILPSFNLLLEDSLTYFNTNNIISGNPVVLFYFSPRCPYCRAQMDEIVDNISTLSNINFYIFTTWPFLEMKEFYTRYKLNKYSNIVVGVDYDNFFLSHFKTTGVPYMAIFGKNRRLNATFTGIINIQQLKKVAENNDTNLQ